MTADLAVAGGPPTRRDPFPPWPAYADDEVEVAASTLRSGKVNQWTGDDVRAFERELAAKVGARHAVAVANGTVALELALRALGVGPGDDVVVPARTFVATASAVAMVGARPVCADVDAESGNVTAATLAEALTPRTKAVIPVHVGGRPCEMDEIQDLAARRGLLVVEDCAQAHGAKHRGRAVGTFGAVGCFSFCQDKILTTGGEGGAVVTDDAALYERMWSFKDHGKSFDAVHRRAHPPGFRWLHEGFGTNWRMTAFQAAIGRVQLGKLDAWVATRRENAARIAKWLAGVEGVVLAPGPAHAYDAHYRLYARLAPDRFAPGWDRDRVVAAIAAEGVPAFSGSCGEIYRETAFAAAGLAPSRPLPNAAAWHATSLAFLTHPTMGARDADDVGAAAVKVLAEAMR